MIQNKKYNKGFTLIEILLYVGITAVIAGSMFGIFNTVTKTGLKQSASNEASTQLNFVMQTVQSLVKSSSLIESPIATTTATSTLKLRMEDPLKDPTCISLVGGIIKLAEGPDENNKQNCTSTLSNLTDNNVVVDQLDFKKFSQYPGHDVVSLNIQITSSSTNATNRVTRNLQASIARVSAATFDSDLIPGSDNVYSVGFSPTRWKDAAFSGNLFVEGNVGVGTSTAATLFSVATSTNIFNVLSSGNVGIGTTTPAYKLDVDGTVSMTGFKMASGTTDGYVLTTDANGVGTWQAAATVTMPKVNSVVGTTDISTTTTAYGDMPGMTYTDTFAASNVLITFSAQLRGATYATTIYFRILVDDVEKNAGKVQMAVSYDETPSIQWVEALSAGSHTIKVQWKVNEQTGYQDGANYHRVLTILRGLN